MLLAVLLMGSVVTISTVILAGLMLKENRKTAFNRFCTAECVDGKHNRNNYNTNQLY